MSHAFGKFIAVIMVIWLPLFSGNALAASMVMQVMGGDHHGAVAQQGEPHMHCPSAAQQHIQYSLLAADQDQSAGEDCGTCHFACGGYMATASIKVMEVQSLARLFISPSSQFQSITLTPLDPPPLARA